MLQVSGTILATGGFLLLCDSSRILLSRLVVPGPASLTKLSQPLFYYFSIGIICLGLILCIAGIIGCWAACLDNYCIFTVVSKIRIIIMSFFRIGFPMNLY